MLNKASVILYFPFCCFRASGMEGERDSEGERLFMFFFLEQVLIAAYLASEHVSFTRNIMSFLWTSECKKLIKTKAQSEASWSEITEAYTELNWFNCPEVRRYVRIISISHVYYRWYVLWPSINHNKCAAHSCVQNVIYKVQVRKSPTPATVCTCSGVLASKLMPIACATHVFKEEHL